MTDDEMAWFLAQKKHLSEGLLWSERPNGTQTGSATVAIGAYDVGDVLVTVLRTRERRWMFKLRAGISVVLEWHFTPASEPRRHANPSKRPDGVPRSDDSPIHEHVWHQGSKLSLPLRGHDDSTLAEAFHSFCRRATIRAGDAYQPPPEAQLSLAP